MPKVKILESGVKVPVKSWHFITNKIRAAWNCNPYLIDELYKMSHSDDYSIESGSNNKLFELGLMKKEGCMRDYVLDIAKEYLCEENSGIFLEKIVLIDDYQNLRPQFYDFEEEVSTIGVSDNG